MCSTRGGKKFEKPPCIIVSECDISTDMEIWEWNYLHVDSTLSCLAYIILIPEINLIPPRAHNQWLDMSQVD